MNEVRSLYLYKSLIDRGFSRAQATMTLAGFMSESRLQYDAIQSVANVSKLAKSRLEAKLAQETGAAIGLFQADSGVKTRLLESAKERGVPWSNPEFQLDFLHGMATDPKFKGVPPYGRLWFDAVKKNENQSTPQLIHAFMDLYRVQSALRDENETNASYLKKAYMPFDQWRARKGRGGSRKDMADYIMENMSRRDAGSIVRGNRAEAADIRRVIESGTKEDILALGHTVFFERAGVLNLATHRLPHMGIAISIAEQATKIQHTTEELKELDDASTLR